MRLMPTSANKPHARTKIVATVGPACRSIERLGELVLAGVDVFRLNMAHASLAKHTESVAWIRQVGASLNRPVAVLIDLAGPKIRLGELPGDQLELREGEEVRFVRGDVAHNPGELVTTYAPLVDELSVGDQVMLADGTIALAVVQRTAACALCRVVQGGVVRSRQGVNLPGVKLSVPAMDEADWQNAVWAAEQEVDFVSLSFVRSPVEVRLLKELLRTRGSRARVVAKIEKQEALDHLEAIVEAADGVMVARGDLGVEIDVARMPVVQKQIVATCNRYQKPVIIATQMLDSMQQNRRPTRAEVTDVANAILDGCDACMLSGETAIGLYPRAAVEMMERIAVATEAQMFERPIAPDPPKMLAEGLHPITQAVVQGVSRIANALNTRLIVVASRSGVTALAMSKQRNAVPTVGISDCETTLRQMCLYFGVTPLAGAPTDDNMQLLRHIDQWGRAEGRLHTGDRIVLVAGTGMGTGGHNMAIVHEVT
jgi:pyruvate kinase